MNRPTTTCAGCEGTYPDDMLTDCPDKSGDRWCPDCAYLARLEHVADDPQCTCHYCRAEHTAADPHCTCPDCISDHAAREVKS